MDDELYHHGIKGMKWGIRRTPAQLGHTTGKKKKHNPIGEALAKRSASKKSKSSGESRGTQPKQEQKRKKKPLSEMSDQELREAVNRLQLERQYRELSRQEVSGGKKFINTLNKQVVSPAVTSAGRQLLQDYLLKEGRKQLGLQNQNNDKNKK